MTFLQRLGLGTMVLVIAIMAMIGIEILRLALTPGYQQNYAMLVFVVLCCAGFMLFVVPFDDIVKRR